MSSSTEQQTTTQPTYYNTEEIANFMQSVYPDHVDGYNQLDGEGLIQAAITELREPSDTSIPLEFEVACHRIEALHREQL
jgi:hypothetical protein